MNQGNGNIQGRGIRIFLFSLLIMVCSFSYAQNPTDSVPGDPGALTVYTVQSMNFGAFSTGNSGGTISISSAGARSVSGTVIPLNMGVIFHQAIFDINTPEGSVISILNGTDVTLTGSNGGSMQMYIGNSDPGSPFITTVAQPARTPVNIGGTLTVGNAAANPPGTYSGTFYITFNQE